MKLLGLIPAHDSLFSQQQVSQFSCWVKYLPCKGPLWYPGTSYLLSWGQVVVKCWKGFMQKPEQTAASNLTQHYAMLYPGMYLPNQYKQKSGQDFCISIFSHQKCL